MSKEGVDCLLHFIKLYVELGTRGAGDFFWRRGGKLLPALRKSQGWVNAPFAPPPEIPLLVIELSLLQAGGRRGRVRVPRRREQAARLR